MTMAQPRSSLKRQQRERTRRRLLESALSLFASEGYEATSIEDICKKAALSKGAFYFHFPDKEALLAEALEGLEAGLSADSGFSSGSVGNRPWVAGAGGKSPRSNSGISATLQVELWAQALRQERVWRHLRRMRTRAEAELLRQLRHRHAAEGADNGETLARALVTLRDGLVSQSLLFSDDTERVQLEAIVAALARPAAGGKPFGSALSIGPRKRSG